MLHEASVHTHQWMMSSWWASRILLCFQFFFAAHNRTHTLAHLSFISRFKAALRTETHSRFPPVKLVVWFPSFMILSSSFRGSCLFLFPLPFAFHPKYATTRVFSCPVWLTVPQAASDSGGICQGNCPSIINEWLIGFLAGFSWQLSITLRRINAAFSVWSQFI